MSLTETNNVNKWLVNRGGLMGGEHIIYVATAPDEKEVIIGVQNDINNELTYRQFDGSSWEDFSEFNHECYAYTRIIE